MGCCPGPSRPCGCGLDDSMKPEYRNPQGRPKSPFPSIPNRKPRSACDVSRSWPETRVRLEVPQDRPIQRLLLIYRHGRAFSTHGSEMYLGPCSYRASNMERGDRSGKAGVSLSRSLRAGNQAPAELDEGQISPAI